MRQKQPVDVNQSGKDMTQVPKTNDDLKEMVYHTDARVTAMEGQISNLAVSQQRSEGKLDQLITTMSQPRTINWAAWVGVGLTSVAMLIAGSFGIVSYTTLASAPLEQDVAQNREATEVLQTFQNQTHYEFGVFHTQTEDLPLLRERIRALEQKAAAAEVSRKAIGDYVKELGQKVNP